MCTERSYKDNAPYLIAMKAEYDYNFHPYIRVDKRKLRQKE